MRVDVKKYLFVGAQTHRNAFFEQAQEAGVVEFIDAKARPYAELPEEVQTFAGALKIIRRITPVEQEEIPGILQALPLAKRVVTLYNTLEILQEERRIVEQDLHRIAIYGDFSVETIAYIQNEGHRVIQFFATNKADVIEAPSRPEVIYVGSGSGLAYYVAINRERTSYEGMFELIIDRPAGALQRRLHQVELEVQHIEKELKGLAAHEALFREGVIAELNKHHLYTSQTYVASVLGESVFAVEGWVAKNQLAALEKLLVEQGIYADEIVIEDTDQIPTCLHNQGWGRVGEDVIQIYDMPAVTDKDPSTWVLGAFTLFFAMIIADAGYGLVLLTITGLLFYKFKGIKGLGKRFLKLCALLSVATIIWGVCLSSYFGLELSIYNTLRAKSPMAWVIDKKADYHLERRDDVYKTHLEKYPKIAKARDGTEFVELGTYMRDGFPVHQVFNEFFDTILFELAFVVGIIHLTTSFFRFMKRRWGGIGWIMFMIGGYLYFPSIFQASTMVNYVFAVPEFWAVQIGLPLIYVGIGLAVLLSVLQCRWHGLLEIMLSIQVFADVLSYVRLYALALAGVIMAMTFNAMGESVGFVFGGVIILFGHIINILMATMGGVIHGLRLNFLEWYHYSFEGGGKMFRPLMLFKNKEEE